MLYICSSPYQIFNAIHHMWHVEKKEKQDLLIIDFFENSKSLYDSIVKSNIFGSVYFVDKEKKQKNKLDSITTIARIMFPKVTMNLMISGNAKEMKSYSKIVSSTYITDTTLVLVENNKRKNVVLEVIEDGTGPYLYGAHGYSKLHELFSKITGKGVPTLPYGRCWFYEPSFTQKRMQYQVCQMPKAIFGRHEIELINKAMNISEKQIKEKYIFIFDGAFLGGPSFEMQKHILEIIIKIVGKNNIAIKLHPSFRTKNSFAVKELEQNIPWELYCLNNNMNDKVIFNANSTAGFTPKFIFDHEPSVFFLNRYYGGEYGFKDSIYKMQEKLQEIYSEKELIKYIKTEAELIRCVQETIGESNE